MREDQFSIAPGPAATCGLPTATVSCDQVVLTRPRQFTHIRRVSAVRLVAAGLTAALLTAALGMALEWWRFGANEAGAASRIERQVRDIFSSMTSRVQAVAHDVASDPGVPPGMVPNAEDRLRALFDAASRARDRSPGDPHLLAVTIYDSAGVVRAWAGRPSDLAPERTKGTAALFVTPSPLGLRLVYVQPILDAAGNSRLGSVAVEHVITPGPATPEINPLTRNYTMPTTLGPVGLRLRFEGAGERTTPDAFTITAPDGAPLVEASVAPADLAASRQRWRRGLIAVVLAELGLTLLLTIGPLLDRRAIAASSLRELRFTLAIAAVIAASGGLGWLALRIAQGGALQWPLALLLSGAVVVGLVAIAVPGAYDFALPSARTGAGRHATARRSRSRNSAGASSSGSCSPRSSACSARRSIPPTSTSGTFLCIPGAARDWRSCSASCCGMRPCCGPEPSVA